LAELDVYFVNFANAVQRTLMTIISVSPFQDKIRRLDWIRKDFWPQKLLLKRRQLFKIAVNRIEVNQADRIIGRNVIFNRA
jgi:hypothetical protein